MTTQDFDSLLNLIKADPDLRKKLEACETAEAAQRMVAAAGYNMSVDEMLSLRSNSAALGLTDAELESVAGGRDKNSNGDTCRDHGCPGG
jgi:predicted ribosomally synthesized peptide with nif11-like leader